MPNLKKGAFFIFLLLLSFSSLYSEGKKVDFYGVLSLDADSNMVKMTEDLYYTQLKELDINLIDKRNENLLNVSNINDINFSHSDKDSNAFYVYIRRNGDALSKWECSIIVKDMQENNTYSYDKEYDSYYKILMESKTNLNSIFINLINNHYTGEVKTSSEDVRALEVTSTESIAGTWEGESHIDKIVILKAGRGFIIFKNGATMNIQISILQSDSFNKILVRQQGHSNASFYPELKRSLALEKAIDANPIEWNLTLEEGNILSGTKKTLIPTTTNEDAKEGLVNVRWTKRN